MVRRAVDIDPLVAPSLHQLVRMHVTAKPGKAFGEDALPNELFRAFPTELAMVIMPVMWTAAFRL